MVSNGQLTQASIDRIQEYVNAQVAGQNNYSKFIIIEAEGQFDGQESGIPKIAVEKMTDSQTRDQLFQQYSANNADKIRQCFRLPPIFVGRSDDYTRATAEASRRLADEQVFSPEREEFDNTMNQRVMPELGVIYHQFISNGPNITDDEDLINVIAAAEKSGGMTPRLAREIIADILGMDEHALPPLDPSIKPDVPFTLQVAEAVKNTADPNHQLAVKSLLGSDDTTVRALMKLRDDLELALIQRKRRHDTEG
jgi:capsid portal protein